MKTILPENFDWKTYLLLNEDLNQNATFEEVAQHYLNYGFYENRKYLINKKDIEDIQETKNIHILIVIVSCCKNNQLWNEIKNRTNNELIIIAGTNDKNIKGYDKSNKILYLNCNDYYDGLPEKIILMIEEVLNNPEFSHITHILKIDDHDNFFNDNVINNLYNYDELLYFDYIGQKKNCWEEIEIGNYHFGKVPENSYWYNREAPIDNVVYFDGGCSYILNRKAMKIINNVYNSNNIDELRVTYIYEDLMIGKILDNNNVNFKQLNYGIIGDKIF